MDIILFDISVFLGKIFTSDGVKISLRHKDKCSSLTELHSCSSFFTVSETVGSCRVFQNLLVSLALFARSSICVTNKKEKSTASSCCLLPERLHRTSTKC